MTRLPVLTSDYARATQGYRDALRRATLVETFDQAEVPAVLLGALSALGEKHAARARIGQDQRPALAELRGLAARAGELSLRLEAMADAADPDFRALVDEVAAGTAERAKALVPGSEALR